MASCIRIALLVLTLCVMGCEKKQRAAAPAPAPPPVAQITEQPVAASQPVSHPAPAQPTTLPQPMLAQDPAAHFKTSQLDLQSKQERNSQMM
jgi:hypothetical protein